MGRRRGLINGFGADRASERVSVKKCTSRSCNDGNSNCHPFHTVAPFIENALFVQPSFPPPPPHSFRTRTLSLYFCTTHVTPPHLVSPLDRASYYRAVRTARLVLSPVSIFIPPFFFLSLLVPFFRTTSSPSSSSAAPAAPRESSWRRM